MQTEPHDPQTPPAQTPRPEPDVWIVGKLINETRWEWEFQGVFSTEQLAIEACLDYRYFVGPARMDERLPSERAKWPSAFYPRAVWRKPSPPID